jgi:hypothetical protein
LVCADDDLVAVVAVVAVVGLWWLSSHGKGTAPGRLVAWGSMVIVVWVLVGFKDPHTAGVMAEDFVSGISRAASGFASFLHTVTS